MQTVWYGSRSGKQVNQTGGRACKCSHTYAKTQFVSERTLQIEEEGKENEPTPRKRINETSTLYHTQVKTPDGLKA